MMSIIMNFNHAIIYWACSDFLTEVELYFFLVTDNLREYTTLNICIDLSDWSFLNEENELNCLFVPAHAGTA